MNLKKLFDKKPVLITFIVFVLSAIIVFLLFITTNHLIVEQNSPKVNLVPSASADTLNVIFGLPLVLITSMIAIFLAGLGLELARNQDRRDAKIAAKSVADKYSELVIKILDVNSSIREVAIVYRLYADEKRDKYLECENCDFYQKYDSEIGGYAFTDEFYSAVKDIKKDTQKKHYSKLTKALDKFRYSNEVLEQSLNKVLADGDAMEIFFSTRGKDNRKSSLVKLVEMKGSIEFSLRYIDFLKHLSESELFKEFQFMSKDREEFENDDENVKPTDSATWSVDVKHLKNTIWCLFFGHYIRINEIQKDDVYPLAIVSEGIKKFQNINDLIPSKLAFSQYFFNSDEKSQIEFISKEILNEMVFKELSELDAIDMMSESIISSQQIHETDPNDLDNYLNDLLENKIKSRVFYLDEDH